MRTHSIRQLPTAGRPDAIRNKFSPLDTSGSFSDHKVFKNAIRLFIFGSRIPTCLPCQPLAQLRPISLVPALPCNLVSHFLGTFNCMVGGEIACLGLVQITSVRPALPAVKDGIPHAAHGQRVFENEGCPAKRKRFTPTTSSLLWTAFYPRLAIRRSTPFCPSRSVPIQAWRRRLDTGRAIAR
jgi:hypothetical protein